MTSDAIMERAARAIQGWVHVCPSIPTFLLRGHPDCTLGQPPSTASGPVSSTPPKPQAATAPAAAGSAGSSSGSSAGVTVDEFARFRVDPEEIEQKIKAEADRRWREWLPTKTDRKRPRLSTYIRQVRKEYYP